MVEQRTDAHLYGLGWHPVTTRPDPVPKTLRGGSNFIFETTHSLVLGASLRLLQSPKARICFLGGRLITLPGVDLAKQVKRARVGGRELGGSAQFGDGFGVAALPFQISPQTVMRQRELFIVLDGFAQEFVGFIEPAKAGQQRPLIQGRPRRWGLLGTVQIDSFLVALHGPFQLPETFERECEIVPAAREAGLGGGDFPEPLHGRVIELVVVIEAAEPVLDQRRAIRSR